MGYRPKPVDTSRIKLPAKIAKLTEMLAENTHEVWARQRMEEGWTWGGFRDDHLKTHPSLVPYDQLSESEKDYDRRTALETLKTITALGYRIESPADSVGPDRDDASLPGEMNDLLDNLRFMDLGGVLEHWRVRQVENWASSPTIYQHFANRFLQLGEPLLAYDVASEGSRMWPGNVVLRQRKALALFRSKVTRRAMLELNELYKDGHRDEDTMGLMARAHKDLADQADDPGEKTRHWRMAYEIYRAAARETGGYYTGINAATLARVLGKNEEAFEFARQVKSQCLAELERTEPSQGPNYWVIATLGEAALIMEDWDDARHWYNRASQMAGHRFGDLASTRRNARLLMDGLQTAPDLRERIESCFRLPRVVVFSGHMIDRPDRAKPRFPAHREGIVKERIRQKLKQLDGRVGFASAACGADILFLESILEMGGEIHVILPYDLEHFIRDSVDIIPGGDWKNRCYQILERASDVLTASERQSRGEGLLYDYANLLLLGLAKKKAEQLETELVSLAVWDGKPGDGKGGTGDTIDHWRRSSLDVYVVEPDEPAEKTPSPAGRLEEHTEVPALTEQDGEPENQLRAMLFADAVGFSRLSEEQVVLFVTHMLGAVAGLLEGAVGHRPLTRETWGDGIFFVFKTADEAGRFALEFRDLMNDKDWGEKGLPPDINFRIALHAGPVCSYLDPLTGRNGFMGVHVTRAARLEPITPPGQVYASMEFAALAAVENIRHFSCDYVGQTPLAKGYGVMPVYHLGWTGVSV